MLSVCLCVSSKCVRDVSYVCEVCVVYVCVICRVLSGVLLYEAMCVMCRIVVSVCVCECVRDLSCACLFVRVCMKQCA